MELSWDRVRGAKSYVIQSTLSMSDTPAWAPAGVATKSSFTAAGLASGKRHWFRVAAVGAAGQGPWSDPATKIAPQLRRQHWPDNPVHGELKLISTDARRTF